jgi:hypothetical protein
MPTKQKPPVRSAAYKEPNRQLHRNARHMGILVFIDGFTGYLSGVKHE